MGFGDIFKIEEFKKTIQNQEQEIGQLKKENIEYLKKIEEQESLFTDEQKRAIDLKQYIEKLTKEKNDLNGVIEKNNEVIEEQNQKIKSLKSEIVELEEVLLLQDFGLYQPTYDFSSSEEYKDRLDEIRLEQKQMIKNKTAAICLSEWLVNDNKREGQKMINDNIKQTLLTFNTECENAIDRVKFSNFDSMERRIEKIYDKLNKLNSSLNIKITWDYYDLKMQELKLAYEYACKKQEEKEFIKEQREIQRENARVLKELEAERKRIEKEQTHYSKQMARLEEQLENEKNEARKEMIKEKIAAIKAELVDLDKALKDVDYRQANERAGYVYIISNIGAFGEDIYKIGMTRRLEPMDRIDELGGASVPFRFDVHALIFSSDAPKLETALHNAFANKRINMVNGRKEFFRVSLDEIERVVRQHHDKTVEFKYVPIAEQYRESLKMKEMKEKK